MKVSSDCSPFCRKLLALLGPALLSSTFLPHLLVPNFLILLWQPDRTFPEQKIFTVVIIIGQICHFIPVRRFWGVNVSMRGHPSRKWQSQGLDPSLPGTGASCKTTRRSNAASREPGPRPHLALLPPQALVCLRIVSMLALLLPPDSCCVPGPCPLQITFLKHRNSALFLSKTLTSEVKLTIKTSSN